MMTTNYCKRATSDAGILGIRKDTRRRLLSLPMIGDSQDIFVSVTHGGILFRFCIHQVSLRYDIRSGERVFLRMSYRSNCQSGDRSRNSAFIGSLINDDDLT